MNLDEFVRIAKGNYFRIDLITIRIENFINLILFPFRNFALENVILIETSN